MGGQGSMDSVDVSYLYVLHLKCASEMTIIYILLIDDKIL